MSRPHIWPAALWVVVLASAAHAAPLEFRLTFDPQLSGQPFTGRVYVSLSKTEPRTPRSGPNWFRPEPFFAGDVSGWKPDEPFLLTGSALAYPTPLAKVEPGSYWVQAVMDFNRGERSFAGPGNGYSKAVKLEIDPAKTGRVDIHLDQVVPPGKFPEGERVKLFERPSKLLSDFHGRPVTLRAGVILPKSYKLDPKRRYPVVYEIPGFGGTHTMAAGIERRNPTDVAGVEMLWVVLDPSCTWGHHVFADSANNGPVGQALVEEFIPQLEAAFRGLGSPGARFVTGHSSGGWSSLWLQVRYPDTFGGTWSTAPDPVDFRDFQMVNIYAPGTNIFTDEKGQPRPLARRNGKPMLFYKGFSDMEDVMGHGGQLRSFEAVFGDRGADGQPKKLWDRKTGAIDPEVARSWERYDIRLILERNWPTLAPRLAGKIHVYMGGEDTFYLDGATRLLKESLKQLGSDAVVEIFPGKDHGTLMSRELRQRIAAEMADRFRKQTPTPKATNE